MKLAYSPASPYVRKVTASAIARGIDDKVEVGGNSTKAAATVAAARPADRIDLFTFMGRLQSNCTRPENHGDAFLSSSLEMRGRHL